MKKFSLLFFVLFASRLVADPVEGYWFSYDKSKPNAGWFIYITKDEELRGETVSMSQVPANAKATGCKKRESYPHFPIEGDMTKLNTIGNPWIFGLHRKSEGVWSGGNIIDPSNGIMYTCKITFHAADGKKFKVNTLEMRGGIGIIGLSQYWTETTKEEALAIQKK